MMSASGFGYAQARIQAHLARLPQASDWERLAASRTLAGFLEEARAGVLNDWLKGFSAHGQAHDLEQGLAVLSRESVDRVGDWVPRVWREAVAWIGWLPLLPLLECLARGETLPVSAFQHPLMHGFLDASGRLDRTAADRLGIGPLLAQGADQRLGAFWHRGWRERWPATSAESRRRLDRLAVLVARHLEAFRHAPPDAAWDLRQILRSALRLDLHRNPLQPAMVFAYLGLVFLDLERLRGELVGRVLFAPEQTA